MLAVTSVPAGPFVAVMALGVLVAMAGHVTKIRGMVALGVTLIFLATFGMILGAYISYQGGETDPRPSKPASEPSL